MSVRRSTESHVQPSRHPSHKRILVALNLYSWIEERNTHPARNYAKCTRESSRGRPDSKVTGTVSRRVTIRNVTEGRDRGKG